MPFSPTTPLFASQQLTPWSLVQHKSLYTAPGSLSFTSLPAVGNLVIVAVSSFAASIGSGTVTDNQGNTYTRIPVGSVNDGGTDDVTLFYTIVGTSSGTFTITNTTGSSLAISEFHCSLGTPVYNNNGSSAAVTPGSFTLAVPSNSLIVGAQTDADGGAYTSRAWFTTLDEEDDSSTHERLGVQYAMNMPPGTYTVGFTPPSGGSQGALVGASFTVNNPGLALVLPTNGGTVGATPTIKFAGSALAGQNIAYEIQIDTVNTFNSQGSSATPLVQSAQNREATPATTVAVSLPSTVAGNMIVVAVYGEWGGGLPAITVADGTNTYHLLFENDPDVSDFALFYAYNIAGGSMTVTATSSQGAIDMGIIAREYTAVTTSDPFDQIASAFTFNSNSKAIDSGLSGQPVQDNELVIGFGQSEHGSNTYTVGSGYGNLLVENNASIPRDFAMQDKTITYATPQNSAMTLGSTAFWIGVVVTFKMTVAPLISARTDVNGGFTDVTNGSNTTPFPSGDVISYVPSSLANGTYYWRVRQLSVQNNVNYYGAWSATQSFVVSGGVPTNLFFF